MSGLTDDRRRYSISRNIVFLHVKYAAAFYYEQMKGRATVCQVNKTKQVRLYPGMPRRWARRQPCPSGGGAPKVGLRRCH